MADRSIYERSMWSKDTNSRELARLQDFAPYLGQFLAMLETEEELPECFKSTWLDKGRILYCSSLLIEAWEKHLDTIPKPKGAKGFKRWLKLSKQREALRSRLLIASIKMEAREIRMDWITVVNQFMQLSGVKPEARSWAMNTFFPPKPKEVRNAAQGL